MSLNPPLTPKQQLNNVFWMIRQKSGISKNNIIEAVETTKKSFMETIPEQDDMSVIYYSLLQNRPDYIQMLLKLEEKTGPLHDWDNPTRSIQLLRHAMGKTSENLRVLLLADEKLSSKRIEQKITPEQITQLLDSSSSLNENKSILKNHLTLTFRSALGVSKNGKVNFAQEDTPVTAIIVKKKRTISQPA